MDTRTFRPQFAYALGRDDDAEWVRWQDLTSSTVREAAEAIDDPEHQTDFLYLILSFQEELGSGMTLGEAVEQGNERRGRVLIAKQTLGTMTEDGIDAEMLADRIVSRHPEVTPEDALAAAERCFDEMAAAEQNASPEDRLGHAEELEQYARATGRGW